MKILVAALLAAATASAGAFSLHGSVTRNQRLHAPRSLQETSNNNPACSAPVEEARLVVGNGDDGTLATMRSSFYENCIGSLQVDRENMIHHIKNLNLIFKQYHAFYDIAKDPPASDPSSHGADLGYEIFGEGQGMVNLEERLSEVMSDVAENGATGATFWKMNEPFALLRDGHVHTPPYPDDSPVGSYRMAVYPERSLNGGNVLSRPKFYYDSDGELQLQIQWLNPDDDSTTESLVQSIDGKGVYQYFLDMANAPIPNTFPPVGARLNFLLTFMLRFVDGNYNFWQNGLGFDKFQPYIFNVFPAWYQIIVRPSLWFPDNFTVVYEDGESEVFYSAVQTDGYTLEELGQVSTISGSDIYQLDSTELEARLNHPGPGYQNYTIAMDMAFNSSQEVGSRKLSHQVKGGKAFGASDRRKEKVPAPNTSRRLQEDNYTFDKFWRLPIADEGEDSAWGYKINADEGYAVLKVQGLACYPKDALSMWRNMTLAAKAQNVKKLIVDLSWNGGGNIVCGNALTAAMFPFADYKWYKNVGDAPRNEQMRVYSAILLPLLNKTMDTVETVSADDITPELIQTLKSRAEAMAILLENTAITSGTIGVEGDESAWPAPSLVQLLQSQIENLELNPDSAKEVLTTLSQLIQILTPLYPLFNEKSWTNSDAYLIWEGVTDPGPAPDSVMKMFKAVNRGGVESNVTTGLTIFAQETYDEAVGVALQLDHLFDEYILVSNGVGGSTTAIFADMAVALARNSDRSGVKPSLAVVTYGGTKGTGTKDMTIATHPASIGAPGFLALSMGNIAMSMLEPFMESDLGSDLAEGRALYEQSIPEIPYFSDDGYTEFPVLNYYDNFMQPGAIPEQYIHMQPDYHIQRLYTNVLFQQSSDLKGLYAATAKFFSGTTPDEAPVNTRAGDDHTTTASSGTIWNRKSSCFLSVAALMFVSNLY